MQNENKANDILLIYPLIDQDFAMADSIPLSILYAAAESVKSGYNVKLLDLRCHFNNWETVLKETLSNEYKIAGISVMTGEPLLFALKISAVIRRYSPDTKIIWGGAHPTVFPDSIQHPDIDFLIRGFGSLPLKKLADALIRGTMELSQIESLSYKENGTVKENPCASTMEHLQYSDIPYHLLEASFNRYTGPTAKSKEFPIFTSIGCPYRCTFCATPAILKNISGPHWSPYTPGEVADHVEYIKNKYNVTHIFFRDETLFPDMDRVKKIFQSILQKKINVSLKFRARIDEINRMDDELLALIETLGGAFIFVGVESGSDKVLKIMKKGTTREQILQANRRLAKYPGITPYYHMLYGVPGETFTDLKETETLILQLVKDNPLCIIDQGSDWKPIPGSELVLTASQDFDFKAPVKMEDWATFFAGFKHKKIVHPWYTPKHNNLIKFLQVLSWITGKKYKSLPPHIKGIIMLYKPTAYLRMKLNFYSILVEYLLFKWLYF